MQSKVVNKTRNETLNDSLVQAVANDSGQLSKGNVNFSQLKRTATETLMNSRNAFSNYVDAKLKVGETFIIDNPVLQEKGKSLMKLLVMITP